MQIVRQSAAGHRLSRFNREYLTGINSREKILPKESYEQPGFGKTSKSLFMRLGFIPAAIGSLLLAVAASQVNATRKGGFESLSRSVINFNACPTKDHRSLTVPDNTKRFAELYKKARPAVVGVRVKGGVEKSQPLVSPDEVPIHHRGFGSGFICRSDGLIVTNYHVVDVADKNGGEITIELYNGQKLSARIVKKDKAADLALLKVKESVKGLLTLPLYLGKVEPGDMVAAIGNPLGLTGSMTRGIVSATDRDLVASGDINFAEVYQTDAAINPGNSGGPLLIITRDNAIAVAGINTAIIGGANNIGFVVDQDEVGELVALYDAGLPTQRLTMGVEIVEAGNIADSIENLNHDIVDANANTLIPPPVKEERIKTLKGQIKEMEEFLKLWKKNTNQDGMLVTNVIAGSLADKAGFKKGDVITKVNGKSVRTPVSKFVKQVKRNRVFQEVSITFIRKGKTNTILVSN